MANFVSWNGYFPIVVVLAIGMVAGVFRYFGVRRRVLKWLNENGQYVSPNEGIGLPVFFSGNCVRLVAIDALSGRKVEIALRVGSKWFRGVLLDAPVCESVTPVEEP